MKNHTKGIVCFLLSIVLFLALAPKAYPQTTDEVKRLQDEGNRLYKQSRYGEALEYYQKSLDILQKSGDRKGESTNLYYIGQIYNRMEKYEKALEYYQKALTAFQDTGNKKYAEVALFRIAGLYKHMEDRDKALEYYQKALESNRECGDRANEDTVLKEIGGVYLSLGEEQKALEYYEKPLIVSQETGDRVSETAELIAISTVYVSMTNCRKALGYLEKALRIYQETGNRKAEALVLENIGQAYYILKEYPKALPYYEKALRIEQETGNRSNEAKALKGIGTIYDSMGEHQKALQYYEKALTLWLDMGDTNADAGTFRNIAEGYMKEKKYQKALAHYEKALRLSQDTKDRRGEAETLLCIGMFYNLRGEYEKALECCEKSLSISRELSYLELTAANFATIGITYRMLNRNDLVVENFKKAVQTLEAIRGRLKTEELKMDFINQFMSLYRMGIELLIKRGSSAEAWDYIERVRARAFLDMLGNRRINFRTGAAPELVKKEADISEKITAARAILLKGNDANTRKEVYRQLDALQKEYEDTLGRLKVTNPEYASLKSVQIPSLKEVQGMLEKDSLILEFYLGEEKSHLFLIDNESLMVFNLPYSEKEIREEITNLRRAILTKSDCTDQITDISDMLLPEDAFDRFEGKSNLVIVPTSILHYLPFSLLVDENGDYLVKKYNVLVEPSAAVWKLCQEKKRTGGNYLVACALGSLDIKLEALKEDSTRDMLLLSPETLREAFAPLPSTADEVRDISRLYQDKTTFIGKEMTTENVVKSIGRGNLIHFATHGVLDNRHPLFSGLLLSDGIISVSSIFSLDLRANLVVLSACNTGIGELSSGDEIVGMTRAFMYAGAPTIVATLWSVSDESTALLMKSFYENLQKDEPATVALRHAQLSLMEKYPEPFYWAPFFVTGK